MKHPRLLPAAPRRSRGVSMIELMVSMAIGLVLMTAVVSAYLGSAGASKMTDAQSRMNEDAQAALSILSQQIRMAGNNPKQPRYSAAQPRNPIPPEFWAVRGCDGSFSNVSTATSIQALTCSAGTVDALAVSYEADRHNTVASGVQPTDCLGQVLPSLSASVTVWNTVTSSLALATTSFHVADNRFYVANLNSIPNLYCKGNGGAAGQPLVENVEDLQVTYGVAPSTATTTLTVAGYLTQAQINADAALAALPEVDRWSKVATVRICVLVRSEQPVVNDAGSARYVRCDGTTETAPPDLRLRRAYSTTVVLRNRIGS